MIPLLSLIFVSNKLQDEISLYLILSCIFSQPAYFGSTCINMFFTAWCHARHFKPAPNQQIGYRSPSPVQKGFDYCSDTKFRGFNSVHPMPCHRFVHQHKSPPSTKPGAITTDITRRTYENSNNRNRNRSSSTTTSNNSKNTNKNT